MYSNRCEETEPWNAQGIALRQTDFLMAAALAAFCIFTDKEPINNDYPWGTMSWTVGAGIAS